MKFTSKLKDKVKSLKNNIYAIYLAFKDKRTPIYAKIMIGLTISYALSPIDLIPDFIPILGYLDDLILLPLMISLSIKLIPNNIWIECKNEVKENYQLDKSIGIPTAIIIILIWMGILGIILYKILN